MKKICNTLLKLAQSFYRLNTHNLMEINTARSSAKHVLKSSDLCICIRASLQSTSKIIKTFSSKIFGHSFLATESVREKSVKD